jgi:polyhydroxyalkanoate synthesis regulator phasin
MSDMPTEKHGKQIANVQSVVRQTTVEKLKGSVDRFEESILELEKILKRSKLANK